jgi:type I restriction enzyme S subunit
MYALIDYDVSAFNFAAAQPKLNQKNAKKIQIKIPSLPEQRSIVAYLDSLHENLDELKKLQDETEKEIEELTPSILDKAFKGDL